MSKKIIIEDKYERNDYPLSVSFKSTEDSPIPHGTVRVIDGLICYCAFCSKNVRWFWQKPTYETHWDAIRAERFSGMIFNASTPTKETK